MTENQILPFNKKRKRIVLKKFNTNPSFGKNPKDKTLKELLENSYINLDKPEGPTSHQVDSWIKKILKTDKIGHSGTLDPNATGVLPIGVGSATKLLQYLLTAGKEYIALMKLHKDCEPKKIKEICKGFIGKITQIPPVRSAVKREKRKREIYYLEILEVKDREVLFKVGCESGTYVRTLVVDIGKKLKSGAHLAELRRSKVGHITEDNSFNLYDLKDAMVFYSEDSDDTYLKKILRPVEEMLYYLPKIVIHDNAVNAICHGANLMKPGIVELDSEIKKDDLLLILTLKGEAVAVSKAKLSTEEMVHVQKGECAILKRVIMKTDIYPSVWKKS